ncbi:3-isopropylmalate dehydratase small subunit [Sphingomonas glacialis]|uniref:3-isopropylmalate dehydratase small subunit n=1 Tax=Sphingomonas glacialis TaxID=658225 RepID=A0A502FIT4_9SPHN|nr:3-isopropylmalate dehydratase small subunit [Sphingomonas glacialis]TPG49417.1 3-isopropylmalate dehydratase small subunit [Sphingomonas glacialis]
MTPFTTLSGTAAPLPEENVDTDIIFPARFLLITARAGLGRYAFHDRRFDAQGAEIAGFVLNRAPWRDAPILLAGANFGSGSSREQAVWALLGQGITCVIAPSFGEIFYGNCFRNGVLPIRLPTALVTALTERATAGERFAIDLEAQTLRVGDDPPIAFEVGAEQRLALLNGWDETALILNASSDDITAFEARQKTLQPWLYDMGASR